MQIPDEIRKCVAFVCYTDCNEEIRPVGTAFFVGISVPQIEQGEGRINRFSYIVTAKHVVEGIKKICTDQKILLKIDTADGTHCMETPVDEWLFHPTEKNIDVAVLNFGPPQNMFNYLVYPAEFAVTDEIINKEEIGVGDDVFITGLFANHTGLNRNLPIVRVGNIAAMPEEKVCVKGLGDIDAYLIEARSIGGLSGSPAFVYMGNTRKIGDGRVFGRLGPEYYWLGIIHGHFDLPNFEFYDKTDTSSLVNLKINMGIAIVVPAWKVLEVLNQEVLTKRRSLTIEELSNKDHSALD